MELREHQKRRILQAVVVVVLVFANSGCVTCSVKNVPSQYTGRNQPKEMDRRYLLVKEMVSEAQTIACATTCILAYKNQTVDCCQTGSDQHCQRVPVDILKSYVGQCLVDGVWMDWSEWSVCSKSCGTNGQMFRTRQCVFPSNQPIGNNCTGPASETTGCGSSVCPVDGLWTDWSDWSTCSTSCGSGIRFRSRHCAYSNTAPRGNSCTGPSSDISGCSTNMCPVDGVWVEWSTWTTCSKTCGGGETNRTRHCVFPSGVPRGQDCLGLATQNNTCNTNPCPVDGVWTHWSVWTPCTASCGSGNKYRSRQCTFPPDKPRGHNCTGPEAEKTTCNTLHCPVDGTWSDWSTWTTCSTSCGGGETGRTRHCVFPSGEPRGHDCIGPATQNNTCNTTPCPVDGVWTHWSVWTPCTASCGGGNKYRSRHCDFPPDKPRGHNCTGPEAEKATCNSLHCPVDGVWSDWSTWTTCSTTCGGGETHRTRHCTFLQGVPRGHDCIGPATQKNTCNTTPCPVDGLWTDWTMWTSCSVTCGGGSKFRTRHCAFPNDKPRGHDCSGPTSEKATCSNIVCPVDGVWTDWSLWTTCTKSCGGGEMSRTRQCSFSNDAPRGHDCTGPASQVAACSTAACPDCFYDSTHYMGIVSTTITGKPCLNWADLDPNMQGLPYGSATLAGNMCRDPVGRGFPWCFTSASREWEFCHVNFCQECFYAGESARYQGYVSTDALNNTCSPWTDHRTVHGVTLSDSNFPDNTIAEAKNYCRDPYGIGRLQCYVGSNLRDCGIPQCLHGCADKQDAHCAVVKPYVCKYEFSQATLCPQTCSMCKFGLMPPVHAEPPQVQCEDKQDASCEALKSIICADPAGAVKLCPKTCNKCNILYAVTTVTTSTTLRPTTTPIPHWLPWESWECNTQDGACYQKRFRHCSTSESKLCEDLYPGTKNYSLGICTTATCPEFYQTHSSTTGAMTTSKDVCEDDAKSPGCSDPTNLDVICKDRSLAWAYCARSCDLCDTCWDYLDTCNTTSGRQFFCSSDTAALKYCRKTCGKCYHKPVTVEENDCGDPVANDDVCDMVHTASCICNDPDLKIMCRNYCSGKCPKYPAVDLSCVPDRRRKRDKLLQELLNFRK